MKPITRFEELLLDFCKANKYKHKSTVEEERATDKGLKVVALLLTPQIT